MKNCSRIIAGFVLGIALSTGNAFGADEKRAPSQTIAGETNAAWERRVAQLHFDGLPLTEVVRQLGISFPGVNFVLPENAREAVVRITLRDVSLEEALTAIEMESEGRLRTFRKGNLVSFNTQRPSVSRDSAIVSRVFSLASYLEGRSEKESDEAIRSLYEALEIARTMLKKYERDVQAPELTIHRGTKLLIAVGREKDLAVLGQVVNGLAGVVSPTTGLPYVKGETKQQSEKEPRPGPPGNKF